MSRPSDNLGEAPELYAAPRTAGPWNNSRDSNMGGGFAFAEEPQADDGLLDQVRAGIIDDRGPGSLNEDDYRPREQGGGPARPERQPRPEPSRMTYPNPGPRGRLGTTG
ncbi:MAG TPA: hypothetical protein VME67_19550 [Mycobacterium sp.]|nr:hypothetical protein [Mycobacterium sp.]HTX96853.1 hypothetical protein [Mycobacterium sp.]